ncbi:MAG: hypothetical protein HY698_16100 [Deltaproteobacteria bacterium]|nr:hypothetical protein [Deltaproteobacteria bacterium]
MASRGKMSRSEALTELQKFGISGKDVYLLDVIPLLEMIWADGKVQAYELSILESFIEQHVDNLNCLAGTNVLSSEDGRTFVSRFLRARPDPEVLAVLRSMIPPVRLSNSSHDLNEAHRRSIVRWCLDIGSACAAEYPCADRERFNEAEKQCFMNILQSLS